MTRLAPILLAALTLAAGLAACGGDGPSQEEYVEDAERVCKDAITRLEEIGQDAESPGEIADAVDTVIAETRQTIDELDGLERPDGDAGETAGEFVDAMSKEADDKAIPALEDLRDAVRDQDEQAAEEAAQRLQGLDTSQSDRLARELGADGCVD
jgi:hypothetical protein